MGWMTGELQFDFWQRQKIFPFSKPGRLAFCWDPASLLCSGQWGQFP